MNRPGLFVTTTPRILTYTYAVIALAAPPIAIWFGTVHVLRVIALILGATLLTGACYAVDEVVRDHGHEFDQATTDAAVDCLQLLVAPAVALAIPTAFGVFGADLANVDSGLANACATALWLTPLLTSYVILTKVHRLRRHFRPSTGSTA